MRFDFQVLKERLVQASGVEDPAKKALVAEIATDLANMTTRALAGENVATEMNHVRMQATQLTASTRVAVSREWGKWVQEVVTVLIQVAL